MKERGKWAELGVQLNCVWRLNLSNGKGKIRKVKATGIILGPFFFGVIFFMPKNSIEVDY